MSALHFIGFLHPNIGPSVDYDKAVRVFGKPDFVHRYWDVRAKQELAPGDVAIFASGSIDDPVNVYTFTRLTIQRFSEEGRAVPVMRRRDSIPRPSAFSKCFNLYAY